jgi:hypothetical protein
VWLPRYVSAKFLEKQSANVINITVLDIQAVQLQQSREFDAP